MVFAAALALFAPRTLDMEAAWRYAEASRTQAMLVMKDGKTIFERYANGFAQGDAHPLASGTKSFNGVVAAFGQADGVLDLEAPVAKELTEWSGDARKSRITYRQLLDMTDGLDPNFKANALAWKAVIAAEAVAEPGTGYVYSGVHHNAFAAAFSRKLKGEKYEAYLERKLLRPLGISIVWRGRDDEGNPQVAGGGTMTARGWARFGEFVRKDGEGMVPKETFRALFVGSKVNPAYGLSFWLKPKGDAGGPVRQPSEAEGLNDPAIPDDLRAALGAGKQALYVVPSLGLTVVRFGPLGTARQFSHKEFLKTLLGG